MANQEFNDKCYNLYYRLENEDDYTLLLPYVLEINEEDPQGLPKTWQLKVHVYSWDDDVLRDFFEKNDAEETIIFCLHPNKTMFRGKYCCTLSASTPFSAMDIWMVFAGNILNKDEITKEMVKIEKVMNG